MGWRVARGFQPVIRYARKSQKCVAVSSIQSGYRFGPFELNLRDGELRKHGIKIRLQDQPLKILRVLLENPGAIVTREQLRENVWASDTFVDFDNGLNAAIRRLRDALGDSAENPRYIETVPRHGYRFIFLVERSSPASSEPELQPSVPIETSHSETGGTQKKPRPTRTLWVAVTVLVFVAVIFSYFRILRRGHTQAKPEHMSIIVLPFVNLTGDASQEFFSDGLTEEMITELSGLDPARLAVVARTSAMQYKNSNKSVAQIARELGVNYVLEGSVRRSGNRVRVTAQLIEGNTQMHLWARDFDRELKDVLSIEREVADDIAQEITLRLAKRPQLPVSVNPDAHDAYLRGRYFWNRRTEQDLLRAIQLFQEAIDKDPKYAPAYSGVADAYIMLGNWRFLSPSEAYPKAKAAAQQAIAIDAELADATASLAFVSFLYDWDWAGAEKEFQRAIALNRNYASAHHYYAVYLMCAGRRDEALEQIQIAERLDPLSLIISAVHAWLYELSGDYDAAIRQGSAVVDMDQDYAPAHLYIGKAQLQKHEYYAAIANFKAAINAGDTSLEFISALAEAYALAGDRKIALEEKRRIQQIAKHRYVSAYELAQIDAALGDREAAIRELQTALDEHFPWMVLLGTAPEFVSFRNDPRFQNILDRVGLPPKN